MAQVEPAMLRVATFVALIILIASACTTAEEPPSTSSLSAAKTTCNELVLADDSSGFVLVDRVLVPFSRIILGVESTYEDGRGRTVTVVSGGYLDDVTEPYDDLQPAGAASLADSPAELMHGSFLSTPIAVAYRLGTEPPCSTLAVVGTGFSTVEFEELLRDMSVRKHGDR